ncbi:hypothetical protein TNCV_5134551 [Trichonephila clavipes]|nr:hypothetical protein TNCV_5134551 [Trichonephila clavipes]
MEINGIDRVCLRDSGSSIDVCSRNWINENDLLGQYVWLKSPLDEICHCLPLAKIKIKTKKGEFYTKAAIKQDSSDNDLYLLGNRTAELLESNEQGLQLVNAVVTRREDDSFIIPSFEGEGGKSLAKVNGVEFKEEQRKCPDLKPLWDKAQTGIDKEFRIFRGKLVSVARTKRGEEVRQLCVPLKFRIDINKLSHDEIGGIWGSKTKDRILRHFFWPNVYRDVEEFVKTCNSCQRVGKPRDKAKAPLKLVPIIWEVFSKINIDAVRPLPVSTKQNRYLITSICVASKYPEAIPVESITSPNVIDALLSIFSRIGFPREIQSDLATSFTSELTTTFFNTFGIKVTRSSVSHPQTNAVERVHRTIKHVIKALCVKSGEDWERVLPLAQPDLVSQVVEEVSDELEEDAEIPYPDKQCKKFDYHEILRESQLQLKLSPSQIDELKQVITKNKDVFSPDPGTTHLMRMDIELISDKPIKTKPYRMSPRQINILREEIKRLLELGVIEIGQSDYTFRPLL